MLLDAGCVVCKKAKGPVCHGCRNRLRPAAPVHVPGVAQCRVAFQLDDYSRPIIAAYKYRRQRRIARWMGAEIAHLVPRCADVITWVPATPERRQRRGYDQAQELARVLGRLTEVPVQRLLRRDRHDVRQTGRTRTERLAGPSLRKAQAVAPAFIVVVDDVITTGSSMRAAAETLTSAMESAETPRIVALAAASTPAARDVCLHGLANRSSMRQWT